MQDRFDAMQTSQNQLQSTIDKQLEELKALTERTAAMQIQPAKAAGVESSMMPSTSRSEALSKDRINTVLLPLGSLRFPVSMLEV